MFAFFTYSTIALYDSCIIVSVLPNMFPIGLCNVHIMHIRKSGGDVI